MIKTIGPKRVLMIAVLLAVNLMLAATAYFYFLPKNTEKQRDLRRIQAQIAELQSDIGRLQIEFDQLETQQDKYEALREAGFFSSQGRREAEKILEDIQEKANVVSAVANIQPGKAESSKEADKAGYKILKSPMNIKIEALDDIDVFRYLYLLESFFPGHITIDSLKLERKSEVTGTILRSIAAGNNPPLVEADIEMTWRTMIPDEAVINKETL